MRIFIVLLTIVMCMFILNYLFLKNATQLMHNQVKDNNRLVSNNIIQYFDDAFRNVFNLIYSIDNQPHTDISDKTEDSYNNYRIYKSLNKLVSTSSTSDFIEEVVVYNEHSTLAITPAGTLEREAIFTRYYQNNQYNTVYWSHYFKENNALKVFPARHYSQITRGHVVGQKNLLVVAGKVHRSFNNILVFIDVNKLIKTINNNESGDLSITILDQSDEVILSSDADINLVDMVNDIYVGEGKKRLVNNKEYEYIIYKSDYNGFTYINRMPYEDGFISAMTKTHRTIMYISIFLALFITYLFSLYLFQPNIKIKTLIGGDYSWNNIYNTIHNIKQEKIGLENKVKLSEMELKKDLFLYAIGQSRSKENLQLPIEAYLDDFLVESQLMLIKLVFKSKEGKPWQPNKTTAQITSLIERELKPNVEHMHVFHVKVNEYLILIGMSATVNRDEIVNGLKTFIKKTEQMLKEHVEKPTITAALSKVYHANIDNLQAAYQTIVDLPFYRNINTKNAIYDIEQVFNTVEAYYPAEEIDKLSNLFMSGNEAEAMDIIKMIFDENIKLKVQYFQFASILQSIILNLKRHLHLNDKKLADIYQLELALFNALREATDFKEIEKMFMKIIAFISKELVSEKETKLNRSFIAQYIELHYMESLYLEHMADVTKTTPKYFSKFFKNTFGVNFVEYLNRIRINHAKDFLKNENYSVAEIGEKIGFMHATTFSSTFKRFTGLTPTQYRNKHL